jgi:signal transduction histidine kinase
MQSPARPLANSQLTVELETYLGELLFDHVRLAEEKDIIIAQAVHDLRGPITTLKLYVYLLERAEPEQREKYIATLKHCVDDLVQMTQNLIEQVRPDSLPPHPSSDTPLQ